MKFCAVIIFPVVWTILTIFLSLVFLREDSKVKVSDVNKVGCHTIQIDHYMTKVSGNLGLENSIIPPTSPDLVRFDFNYRYFNMED